MDTKIKTMFLFYIRNNQQTLLAILKHYNATLSFFHFLLLKMNLVPVAKKDKSQWVQWYKNAGQCLSHLCHILV